MEWPKKNRFLWEFLLLWGAWMLIILVLTDIQDQPNRLAARALISFVGFFIVVLINVKYLFPTFFLKQKQGLYYLLSGLLIVSTVGLMNFDLFPWSEYFQMPSRVVTDNISTQSATSVSWFREIVHLLIALLGSTLIGTTRFANKKEKETIYLQNEKLETELKFLKSQVNPHFLFNALNNIYSLSVMQSEQTSESVMQLSEMLRYMVYDSNEANVPLSSEISYIENFIELQSLKDRRGMNVELNLDKSGSGLKIAPLLFIPFVENAFKHSKIENLKDGFIKIDLKVNGKDITFSCKNSKPKEAFTKDAVGGVGLANTKKRLALLYPDHQHSLIISDKDDVFEVTLKLSLS